MVSLRRSMAFSRWHRPVLGLALLAMGAAACSVLFDLNKNQCSTSGDCDQFSGLPYCRDGLCTNAGPEQCFPGTPSTPDQFANQCSTVTCEKFDNCNRLDLCGANDKLPDPVEPVRVDAGVAPDASPIDAPPPPTPVLCVDPNFETIVVTGSTAVQPLLSTVAPLLAPFVLAYQPSGSCAGVENIFNPDSDRRIARDIANRQALRFESDGSSKPCTFGPDGAPVDVGVSDVYASSCKSNYVPSPVIADYLGPIQPMTFVVHAESREHAISAEMAHVVFGLGTYPKSTPYGDPSLYFIRNSTSGTQQMLARAIDVEAAKWWGRDRGGSTTVRDELKLIDRMRADSGIGILSTDFADDARGALRVLAFQAKNQLCGYYPDSTPLARDKINVRDGHYAIWGPVHFYARINEAGQPNGRAAVLVNRFTVSPIETDLLAAVAKSGLVPQCAMNVTRDLEMGPLKAYEPPFPCSCFFEVNLKEGTSPARCKTCTVSGECPAETPACRYGYCEAR
jgi:ABC-type phosphate transport system substrate-binding protein